VIITMGIQKKMRDVQKDGAKRILLDITRFAFRLLERIEREREGEQEEEEEGGGGRGGRKEAKNLTLQLNCCAAAAVALQ